VTATPWRTLKAADAEREYLVVLTYLPLRHLLRLPAFLRHLLKVKRQLAGVQGLLGYSLLAKPLRSKYLTLSVWDDEATLAEFVTRAAHTLPCQSSRRRYPASSLRAGRRGAAMCRRVGETRLKPDSRCPFTDQDLFLSRLNSPVRVLRGSAVLPPEAAV
jgi:hypothetical protein